jgi:cyclohexanecarboxylate-CoA ligase
VAVHLTYLACSRLGAVLNPLMHIFRERELSFMLQHGECQADGRAEDLPRLRLRADARRPAAEPAELQHLVVVGGSGANSFEAAAHAARAWENAAGRARHPDAPPPGPDDITQLIYTSGTTGEPKGVMHSANTLMANIVPYAERLHWAATTWC